MTENAIDPDIVHETDAVAEGWQNLKKVCAAAAHVAREVLPPTRSS